MSDHDEKNYKEAKDNDDNTKQNNDSSIVTDEIGDKKAENYDKLNISDLNNSKNKKTDIEAQDNKQEDNSTNTRNYTEIFKDNINNAFNYATTLPLFTTSVSIICIIAYLLCLLSHSLMDYFKNIPENVLQKFRIWTIFTGSFVSSGFLNLVFCLIFWTHKAKNLEKSLSTIRYMLNFMIDCSITSFAYFIIAVILRFCSTWQLNGLLAVTMCQNTLLCIANPNVKLSLVFYDLEAKYYPFVLSLIMFIIHFGKAVDLVIGILYAFAYFYLIRIQISDDIATRIEERFSFLSRFSSFVSVSEASGTDQSNNEKNQQQIIISTNNFNSSYNNKENKNEISIEKLDKSSDRGNYSSGNNKGSSKQVNYINLEDEKTL